MGSVQDLGWVFFVFFITLCMCEAKDLIFGCELRPNPKMG